jgi:hypothetical protein
MAENRVFLPQQALDQWLEKGRVSLVDDELTITPAGRRFRLSSAVRFTAEVGGDGDPHGLVGKVKSLEQIAVLQGEHCADSVILGDHAYQVVEGFLGEPLSSSGARTESLDLQAPQASKEDSDAVDPLLRLSKPDV